MESIIVALITACATVLSVVLGNKNTGKKLNSVKNEARKDAIRNQILLLIMSDRQNVDDGKLPEHYKTVCELYDEYTNVLHSNSYIAKVVDNYETWVESLETKKKGAMNGKSA